MFISFRHRALRLGVALAIASGAAGSIGGAQTITGISMYRPSGYATNTVDGPGVSKTFVTRGTSPATDAFLWNGSVGSFEVGFTPITLSEGTNTFYLWACCGMMSSPAPSDPLSVNLFAGGNNFSPVLSSFYTTGTATGDATGMSTWANANALPTTTAAGLSWLVGTTTITITEWSEASVARNTLVSSYYIGTGGNPGNPPPQSVGKLVLTVNTPSGPPPVNTVPEPSTWALMSAGVAGLFSVARRRRIA